MTCAPTPGGRTMSAALGAHCVARTVEIQPSEQEAPQGKLAVTMALSRHAPFPEVY